MAERASNHLVINTDGACAPNPGRGSYAVIVRRADGSLVCRFRKNIGPTTNNIAEWRGCLAALDYVLANRRDCDGVELRMDSRLVVEQLVGRWRARSPMLFEYVRLGRERMERLRLAGVEMRVQWVPRGENTDADRWAARRRR